MQGYFLSEMKTGLIIVAMAMAFCFSAVPGAVAGDCGADPTVTVDAAAQDVLPGGSIDYTVTINSASDCNVDISIADSNTDFTASQPDGTPLAVTTGINTMTLTVAAAATTNISETNTTTLIINGDGNAADFEVQLVTTANNPLLHNSFNLGSGKWSGVNGWGLAAGKYGEFDCATCHAKNTGNIKRVKNSIPDTIGAAVVKPVNFQATTGANSFGDDSSIHATSSRICEVCHTYDATGADGVTVHAYNMPVTANHENNTDCISCHLHSTGFAASCSACHGNGGTGQIWPDGIDNNGGRVVYADDQAGAHDNHIAVISNDLFGLTLNELVNDPASTDKQKTICAFCHPSPGGGSHDADGGADARVDMQPAGSFEMLTEGAGTHGADSGSGAYNLTEQSCSNLACHNRTTTPDVSTDSAGWNNPPANPDCSMCHDSNGGTQRHDTHVGGSSFACIECHVDNGTFATGTIGVDHINGEVELKWDNAGSYEATFGDSAVTYSQAAPLPYQDATWGTCSSAACHANSVTPAWNATGVGCIVCHSTTQTTGSHEFHMVLDGGDYYTETGNNSTVTNYDWGCATCHAGDSHVNGSTIVTTHGFDSGTNTCDNASCHGFMEHDGVTYNIVTTPDWYVGFTGDRCAGCHGNSPISAGHDEHQIGFHYDAVYSGFKDFLPVEDTDPKPIGLVNSATLDPYDTLRGHGGLLEADGSANSTTMSCYVCHNDTVKQKGNALAITQNGPTGATHTGCADCHSDTGNPDVGDAALVIADKSKHVNGVRDVVFMREKVRSKAQVRDDIFDVPELSINWTRNNGYKAPDGSSYDESPTTLYDYVGGNGTYNATTMYGYNATTMTCMISCHLWEDGRVDKYPVHWYENSRWNPDLSKHLMCIDCHTRLPK